MSFGRWTPLVGLVGVLVLGAGCRDTAQSLVEPLDSSLSLASAASDVAASRPFDWTPPVITHRLLSGTLDPGSGGVIETRVVLGTRGYEPARRLSLSAPTAFTPTLQSLVTLVGVDSTPLDITTCLPQTYGTALRLTCPIPALPSSAIIRARYGVATMTPNLTTDMVVVGSYDTVSTTQRFALTRNAIPVSGTLVAPSGPLTVAGGGRVVFAARVFNRGPIALADPFLVLRVERLQAMGQPINPLQIDLRMATATTNQFSGAPLNCSLLYFDAAADTYSCAIPWALPLGRSVLSVGLRTASGARTATVIVSLTSAGPLMVPTQALFGQFSLTTTAP